VKQSASGDLALQPATQEPLNAMSQLWLREGEQKLALCRNLVGARRAATRAGCAG
jgi:hypothetical protein